MFYRSISPVAFTFHLINIFVPTTVLLSGLTLVPKLRPVMACPLYFLLIFFNALGLETFQPLSYNIGPTGYRLLVHQAFRVSASPSVKTLDALVTALELCRLGCP